MPLLARSSLFRFFFMVRRLSCCVLCMLPVFQLLAQSYTTPADSLTDSSCDFWRQQLCLPRVRAAKATTGVIVASRLHPLGLTPQQLEIFLRLIKTNRALDVWGRTLGARPFALLHAYPLAATSASSAPSATPATTKCPKASTKSTASIPEITSIFHWASTIPTLPTAPWASPRRAATFLSTAAQSRWATYPLLTRALRKYTY